MRQAENAPTGDTITVTIGRFGQTPMELQVPTNSTVRQALDLANIEGGSGNVFVGGESAQDSNLLDDGDIINVVSSKQGG